MRFQSVKGCLWFLKRDFLSISWRPHSIPSNVSKTMSMKNNPYLFTNSVSVWHIFRPSNIIISLKDKLFLYVIVYNIFSYFSTFMYFSDPYVRCFAPLDNLFVFIVILSIKDRQQYCAIKGKIKGRAGHVQIGRTRAGLFGYWKVRFNSSDHY